MRKSQLIETSKFKKNYKERITPYNHLEEDYAVAVSILLSDSSHPDLNRHFLRYDRKGYESINLNHDYRLVFREVKEGFLLADVGSHDQLYG